MVLASNALTTVESVKKHMTIPESDTSQDSIIEDLINEYSAEIARRCKRVFELTDYDEEYLTGPTQYLALNEYPIIGTPVVADVDGEPVTDFKVRESGMLYRKAGWDGEYTVEYTAGYVFTDVVDEENPENNVMRNLPADLEKACRTLVVIDLQRKGSEHLKTEVVGPLRSDFLTDYPTFIKDILAGYEKPVIG